MQIDYPKEKLEIIIVDDYSTDRTGEIIDEFTDRFSFVKKVIPTERIIPKPGKQMQLLMELETQKGKLFLQQMPIVSFSQLGLKLN